MHAPLRDLQVNALFSHSTLKKEAFKQLKKTLGVSAPGLQAHNATRFLSRHGATSAVVNNYGALLKFTRAEGGRVLQEKDAEREQVRLQPLNTRLAEIQTAASVLDQRVEFMLGNLAQFQHPGSAARVEDQQRFEEWHGTHVRGKAPYQLHIT